MTRAIASTPRDASPPSAPAAPRAIDLHGVRIHAVTERQCIAHVLAGLDAGRGGWVVTPNLDILRRCVKEPEFKAMVEEADLVVADGMPLIWASRLQGTPLPERVAGSNLVSTLSAGAAEVGRPIYLLGGAPGAAEAAAGVLKERFPALRIAGVHCPPMGFEKDPSAMGRIAALIGEARPSIVYVALGSPKQELVIRRLRSAAAGAWWLGVGISLSFLCGDVRRAPMWMQRTGLEWTHRLVQEPRRLMRRYLVDGAPFALRLLGSSLVRRVIGGAGRGDEGVAR